MFSFNVVDEPLFRILGLLQEGLEDFTVPVERADAIISDAILSSFVAGGLPDGWPDITAESRKRRKVDHDTPPLWDSGSLAELASTTAPEMSIGKRSEETLITPYGLIKLLEGPDVRAHQFGNPRMSRDGTLGGSPARPFFEIAPETAVAVVGEFGGYLDYLVSKLEK